MQSSLLIIGLFCQIFVPGWFIGRSFRQDCSISDSFATGMLVLICAGLVSSLLFSNIEEIALASRFILATATLFSFGRLFRSAGGFSTEWQALKSAVGEFPWALSVITFAGTSFLVLSHNLGFDDVAHLDYLASIHSETIFPLFIQVLEDWSVARYPLFGITNAVLTQGFSVGGFLGYYLIGVSVLICFLAKIYDFVQKKSQKKQTAIAVYLLAVVVLIAASFDNYLNFGLYPLQQAKLIFFFGILFLISFLYDRSDAFGLFLSGGLLTSSLAFHFNLILLAPLVVLVGICVLVIERKNRRSVAAIGLVLIVPLFIGILALRSETGFIRYQEPPTIEISDEVEVVKPPEPTIIELIWQRAKSAFMWVSDGHYRDFYIARVYSLELLLIPALLFIGPYLGIAYLFRLTAFSAFLIALGAQAGVRLPLQITSTLLQSGPWAIAVDFWRSGIEITRSDEAVYLTDAYTALVLNGLGYSNVIGLDSKISNQVFLPLLTEPSRVSIDRIHQLAGSKEAYFIINSRYWGAASLEKYKLLDAIPKLDVDEEFNNLVGSAQKRSLQNIFASILPSAKVLIGMPMVKISQKRSADIWASRKESPANNGMNVVVYRDTALVGLPDLVEGEAISLQVDGVGELFEVMIRERGSRYFQSLTKLSGNVEEGQWLASESVSVFVEHGEKKIGIQPKVPVQGLELLITFDQGHLAGLGEIREIKVH